MIRVFLRILEKNQNTQIRNVMPNFTSTIRQGARTKLAQ